jgi:O-antigen/teichoic acid export membrane protein
MIEPNEVLVSKSPNQDAGSQSGQLDNKTGACINTPNNRLSLKNNFIWNFIGNSIYAACQWGMLVVLAKLGNPEMVGRFGLGIALTAPIIMFANLDLRSVLATDARHEQPFGRYLALRLTTSLLALATATAVALVGRYSLETTLVIIGVGAAKSFESVSDLFYGLLQQRERLDRVAKSMITKGFLSLAALSVVIYITGKLPAAVFALAFTWLTIMLFYDVPICARTIRKEEISSLDWKAVKPQWNTSSIFKLARLSLPLGFMMMLVSLNLNIPRYFIQSTFGERDLGIFVALAYLMVILSMIVNALGQSIGPRLAKYYCVDRNVRAFVVLLSKQALLMTTLGAIGVIVPMLAGRQILAVIYRPEYAQQSSVFVWLMAASAIGSTAVILRYGCLSARQFAVQAPLWILIAGVCALGCHILVPIYGIKGAAIALTISASVQLFGNIAILIWAIISIRKTQPSETIGGTEASLEGYDGRL